MNVVEDFTHDVYGNEISFDGNPNLKRARTQLNYTKEHIQEYRKCAKSWKYFAETYYQILSLKEGMIHPKLRDYQVKMIDSYVNNRFSLVLASRQCVVGDSDIVLMHKYNKEELLIKIRDLGNYNAEDYLISTDCGWKNFDGVAKYDAQKTIEIKTDKGLVLKGSKSHTVFLENIIEVTLDKVKKGDLILTSNGVQKVVNKKRLKEKELLYDVLDVEGGRYFSNGILSHNCGKSTSYEIFLCWTILFNKDQRVGILANKVEISRDILRKVKEAYELLPKWLQQGVKIWNTGSIKLENGSMVIASSTSSTAIRGKSIGLLVVDERAFIPQSIWDSFISSVYPTISSSPTSKVIYVSCVTKDTMVFGDKGLQEISEVINPSLSGAYNVERYNVLGKNKFNSGSILVNNGVAPTKVIGTTFMDLECSLPHKLWACKNGVYKWYTAEELSEGDYVSLKYGMNEWVGNDDISDIKIPITTNGGYNYNFGKEISPDLAYFLGLFIAEGYASNKPRGGRVIITCGDDISEILSKLGFNYSKTDDVHYAIGSKCLYSFLEGLGFDLSLKAPKKYIPQRLLQMSRSNIIQMLSGLFDGDGCAYNRGVTYTSSSKKLTMQVKMLLLNLGLLSDYQTGITLPTKKAKVESVYHTLKLGKLDSDKFFDVIGFRFPRKQNVRQSLSLKTIPRNSFDIIPFSKPLLRQYKNLNKKIDGVIKFVGKGGKKTIHYSRPQLLAWKQELQKHNYFGEREVKEFFEENVNEQLRWYKIRSITNSENEVYDFSLEDVDNDKWCHSVLYNGFVGHQTPNGLNHFYKDWMDALEGKNQFNPIKVDWHEVPDRDENWKEETISNIGRVRFAQEYANSFLGSIATLVEPEYIKDLKHKAEIENPKFFAKFHSAFQKYVKIYKEPIKNHTYVLGVDSSKMTEDSSGDALGMQVLDVTQFPFEQVAVFYAKDGISYLQTPAIAVELGTYYNEAYMFVENNEIGQEVANLVVDLEYENIYFEKNNLPGYRTTPKTKRIGCDNLKLLIENNKIILNDFDTISQISTYIRKKKSYEAEKGYKDDLIAALLSALFFMQSKGLDIDVAEDNVTMVKNLLAKNTEEKKAQEEEDAPATFFLDTGDDADLDDADWGNLNF